MVDGGQYYNDTDDSVKKTFEEYMRIKETAREQQLKDASRRKLSLTDGDSLMSPSLSSLSRSTRGSGFTTTSSAYGNFSVNGSRSPATKSYYAGIPSRRRSSNEEEDASKVRESSSLPSSRVAAARLGSRSTRSDSASASVSASSSACVGLSNLGNTCFMNSMLQCLFGVKELMDFFNRSSAKFKEKDSRVARAFQDLVQKVLKASHSSVVSPTSFHEKVRLKDRKWGGMRQHDSQEFVQFLLNVLREQCNRTEQKPKYKELDGKGTQQQQADEALRYYKSWNDSIIDDIFGGLLESSIICSHCGHISYCFDPFLDLSLPVPGRESTSVNLHDCLSKFAEKEELEDVEGYKCEKCKNQSGVSKKLTIYKTPRILILHLKRFSGGGLSRFSRFSKNSAKVSFDMEVDMGNYCYNAGSDSTRYRLFAISHHTGSLSGGHYYAEVENAFDKNWYNFNDSMVSSCRQPATTSSTAYVLFYRKLD